MNITGTLDEPETAPRGKNCSRLPRFIAAFMLPVAALGAPVVTGIANNYSFIPSGHSNSGVAPSSIVTIFGLAPVGLSGDWPSNVTYR